MKPFVVLLSSFVIAIFVVKLIYKKYDFALSARIAMSIMLCFTAIGHFAFTKGMSMMIPEFIPFKTSFVHLTGIFEILLAIGLLIPKLKVISGWALIIFLVLMLPANIYASIHHVNYQKGTFDGNGLSYLWFRIPLQILFIVWAYISSIQNSMLFQN
ncbi:DoxX family protein [Flagellimonas meridianipacifica]|uniref:Putative membrane protein n=1 Tax=Flagellimonas meridianipacifica TaxID=1080225 RepID=A0A2T0MHA8_9FLAO|nr:DoxX family protein [Allomuricauda pacifica]PRX56961.1 putative membrane protein [Allomuricauda pacifica]